MHSQLQWISRGSELVSEVFEELVSISTDGKVLEWNLRKGLSVNTIMRLKRTGVSFLNHQ